MNYKKSKKTTYNIYTKFKQNLHSMIYYIQWIVGFFNNET